MPTKPSPLLCELHAHTTWSDGALDVRRLCDLYGQSGFDVLAITDHVTRAGEHVNALRFDAYLAEIEREAARAVRMYGLLVLPGLELTYDDPDPLQGGHAVAIGLRSFVDVAKGLETALASARASGAALVAAHPYSPDHLAGAARTTAAFAARPELAAFVDRYELFNRDTLFDWVAAAGLPGVANGDFHRIEHLGGWKTLIPSVRSEDAIVDYLRSRRPAYLVRLDEERRLRAA